MTVSTAPASASGLYANPREDWLAQYTEEIIDPARPIVDPHHHLWDRGGLRYLIEEMASDIASGHNIIATVYVDCRSMYRASGPEAFRPVGEVEFANGVAAMSASGGYGKAAICAGIVSHVNLLLGDGAKAGAGSGNRRRQRPLPRHPAFRGMGCRPQCRRHVCDAAERPAARRNIPQGFCLPRPARPQFRRLAVSPADRRTHRSRPRLSRHQNRARPLRRPDRHRQLCRPARGDLSRSGRPRSRKSRNARMSWSSSAASRCACSAMTFICGRSRRPRRKPPRRGAPISRPASRPSGPIAACSKAIFRPTRASAAIR